MNNFFCNNKIQKADSEQTFSEINSNYRREYSKGKSFKVSIWNEKDTYNNDDFVQDFVVYNQTLWVRADSTPSTNEVPVEGPWIKIMEGVSDVQFKKEGNKIFWKYEDESEWKDLFELDIVSESEIKNMLKDIATDVDSNFYDTTLSETSVNAVQNQVITKALNKKADKTELSKKQDVISDLSEIRNKAKSALQSVPSEYITEDELDSKGYLTEHQDISGKQDKIADLEQIRANAQKGATALQTVPAKYATKTDVLEEVAKIVNSAPEAFNTLKEIADWIEEDAEPAIVLANKVEQKVDKVEGLGLSQENFTTEDKEKLAGLENYDDTEIKQELTNLSERVEENEVLIEDLQNTKIDKEADDYYPQLSVGLADNLAGEDVIDSEISFRRSGGGAISDGTARIEAIKGNSVVWNQKLPKKGWIATGNSSYVYDDVADEYTITSGKYLNRIFTPANITKGHKYIVCYDVKVNTSSSYEGTYRIGYIGSPTQWFNEVDIRKAINKWYRHIEIFTVSADQSWIYLGIYDVISLDSQDTQSIRHPRLIDLTLMFGAGNEPTTIEEFNARKPLGIDENAYNEGEVIHMDAQSLESVGVNQWDEEWERGTIVGSNGKLVNDATKIRTSNLIRVLPNKEYHFTQPSHLPIRVFYYGADKAYKTYEYFAESTSVLIPSDVYYIKVVFEYATYNHDICINLSDASINGKYFPYIKRIQSLDVIGKYFPEGMKSAGTAHDEIRYNKATQKWEKVVRIGEVDMGTLNLYYISDNGGYFYGKLNGAKVPSLWSEVGNILAAQYNATNADSIVATGATPFNMSMGIAPNGNIYFVNTSYTDAASFKAAMAGVILYYELAEPIVTEIEDDFNLDYEVWNCGTEEVISDVPTTPLKADIAYGFNAVGKIKELEERIGNLPSRDSSVFEAIYGETTYDEIVEQFNQGKICYLNSGSIQYTLTLLNNNDVYFGAAYGNYHYYAVCSKPSRWYTQRKDLSHNIKDLDNGNVELTIAGKTAEVATPQYVENLLGTIINGDY